MNPIGVAVLTNSNRKEDLKQNLEAFLENCSYRPLVIGIFDNGSTDDTMEYLKNLPVIDGVEWRYGHSDVDLGCGPGVNRANALVSQYEFTIFLESDWTCLSPQESGHDKQWLHECVDFMQTGKADYIYLRRFRNEKEALFHDWPMVIGNSLNRDGKFIRTERFMYSNNPHVRRTKALYDNGTLPMREFYDKNGNPLEKKGNQEWGAAEHQAKHPKNFWIQMWGVFIHEGTPSPASEDLQTVGCNKYGPYGCSTCKYGMLQLKDSWCNLCNFGADFHDMAGHAGRFWNYLQQMNAMRNTIKPATTLEERAQLSRLNEGYHNGLSKVHHIDVRKKEIARGFQVKIVNGETREEIKPISDIDPNALIGKYLGWEDKETDTFLFFKVKRIQNYPNGKIALISEFLSLKPANSSIQEIYKERLFWWHAIASKVKIFDISLSDEQIQQIKEDLFMVILDGQPTKSGIDRASPIPLSFAMGIQVYKNQIVTDKEINNLMQKDIFKEKFGNTDLKILRELEQ